MCGTSRTSEAAPWLTSDVVETHLADLSGWCCQLHPAAPLESVQTNTGNYSQTLFGPGEVPPPELSSSSSSSSSCLLSVKAGVWAQMSPLPDSSWSPPHSYFSVGVQTSELFFFVCLFFVGTSQRGHRSPPPPTHHNSNDTQHPTRSLTATIDSLDCFLSSVYLTSRSRKGTPLPYRTRHCWSALDFKLQCCFSYLGEVPSFLCLRNKWPRYQHLTRSGSFCL